VKAVRILKNISANFCELNSARVLPLLFTFQSTPVCFASTAYTISIHSQVNNTYTRMFKKYLCRVSGIILAPINFDDVHCTVTVGITILWLEKSSRSRRSCDLRQWSAAAWLLKSWVLIPPGGMDTHILYLLCVADDPFRGVLPVVCI